MNLLEADKLTKREEKLIKDMAFTALNNDLAQAKNHNQNHLNSNWHPDCIHCQMHPKKEGRII